MVNKNGNSHPHFKSILTGLQCKRSTSQANPLFGTKLFRGSSRSNSASNFTISNGNFLKSKASQITMFIIIALLVVVAVGIIFVVRNSLKPAEPTLPVGTDNVGDFVTNCLKTTSENGLVLIGRQGGYYNVPSPSISHTGNDSGPEEYFTELGNITIPYYWNGSSSANMPSDSSLIANQLSLYVQGNLNNCLNDFSLFEQKGFAIQKGDIKARTTILDEKVIVSLDYPITITKGESTQTNTAYNVEVPVRLGLIYDLTKEVILNRASCQPVRSVSGGASLNLACFRTGVMPNNFNVGLMRSDNTAIFILTDNDYKLNNNYYDFIFAYKYA